MGNDISPIYIKFRIHYGKNLYKLKDEYLIQFQRFDSDKKPGFIQTTILNKVLDFNKIYLDPFDREYLRKNGFIEDFNSTEYVDYNRFMNTIFKKTSEMHEL